MERVWCAELSGLFFRGIRVTHGMGGREQLWLILEVGKERHMRPRGLSMGARWSRDLLQRGILRNSDNLNFPPNGGNSKNFRAY